LRLNTFLKERLLLNYKNHRKQSTQFIEIIFSHNKHKTMSMHIQEDTENSGWSYVRIWLRIKLWTK